MDASGAIENLLPKFASLLEDEYQLPSRVRKQITSLRHEMMSMSDLLQQKHEKLWRDQVRELTYDTQDCVGIFSSEVFNSEEARRVTIGHSFKKIKACYKIGHRMEQLKAGQLVESSNCRSRYMLHGYHSEGLEDVFFLENGFVDIDPFRLVGIGDPKENFINLLLREDAAGEKLLKVVAIAGSQGMGKTALANKVYTEIMGEFDCTAFVSLSQNADVPMVLSAIFLAISGHQCIKDQAIHKIKEHLQDKRYLIVIDDIWTLEAWNSIKGSFVENKLGSRVITTTQFDHIALPCSCYFHGHIYRIKTRLRNII